MVAIAPVEICWGSSTLQNVDTGTKSMVAKRTRTISRISWSEHVDGKQEPMDGTSGISAFPTIVKIFCNEKNSS